MSAFCLKDGIGEKIVEFQPAYQLTVNNLQARYLVGDSLLDTQVRSINLRDS
jgi:hypothetical protein